MNTLRICLVLCWLYGPLLWAQGLFHVPEPLTPWVDWVLSEQAQYGCPFNYQQFEQKQCQFASQLALNLDAHAGHFNGTWILSKEAWIQLPGSSEIWPQQVMANQQRIAVISQLGHPAVKLPAGQYNIQGEFNWDFVPEQLSIPENTGLIKLTLLGKPVSKPTITDGILWLKEQERGIKSSLTVQDKQDIQVYRQIIDKIPIELHTHIELDIAGQSRDIVLPQALLSGFVAMDLNSELPAHFTAEGQLKVKGRSGHWQLDIFARQEQPNEQFTLVSQVGWPPSEIWTLVAQPELRIVEVQGVNSIDASQTNLPETWRDFPAYRIKSGETLQLKQLRRGNTDPEPSQLELKRQWWLDFDGKGYSIRDQITGRMRNDWRLNAQPSTLLGKVSQNEINQLITRAANGAIGVEVRQGLLNIQADSRYTADITEPKATGWLQNFNQVSVELNLPPGWQLLTASGVDNVPESWLAQWTLLDIFMVLLISLAVTQLWRPWQGVLALVTLILIWHEADAPRWIWLHLVCLIALCRVLPNSGLAKILNVYRRALGISLILMLIPLCQQQLRLGLYPQLATPEPSNLVTSANSNDFAESRLAAAPPQAESVAPMRLAKKLQDYEAASAKQEIVDVDANIQTGPGLPHWHWHTVHLSWNGAVDSQQQLKLWYITPSLFRILNVFRVILLIIFTLVIFEKLSVLNKLAKVNLGRHLSIIFCLLLFAPQPKAQAEFPSPALLDELKQRLLRAPDCLPQCAEISRLDITINPSQLKLALELATQAAVILPLPVQQQQWLPEQVTLASGQAFALQRDATGQLWIQLPAGQHFLQLQGPVPTAENFSLVQPLPAHYVSVNQTGWEVSGVHEHGIADTHLKFSRSTSNSKDVSMPLSQDKLIPFFKIERQLDLGIDWRVHTQVQRLTPANIATQLHIPLLPGEAVLSAGMRTENQQLTLNMDTQQTQQSWDSVLEKTPQLELTAPQTPQWTETWRVNVSPLWHMESEGLPPIHPGTLDTWAPTWQPLPGEKLKLILSRPEAVAGQTLTIERSEVKLFPGQHLLAASLSLQLTSSRGGQHSVQLPNNAELQSVNIDGIPQPIRQQNHNIILPVKPGEQQWQLEWRQPQALGTFFSSPIIDVAMDSVNQYTQVHMAEDRWILMLSGPALGPTVLFWSNLLLCVVSAWILASNHHIPLKFWEWVLLLVGLNQIPIYMMAWVVVWFVMLASKASWLAKLIPQVSADLTNNALRRNAYLYNSLQILQIMLTLVAIGALLSAINQGLLGAPEMQISGNASSAYQLNWYLDRSTGQLPTINIISVPLWVYHALMLAWSLWLAFALLKWFKWGWNCFSQQGLWWSLPPKLSPSITGTEK